MEDFKQISVLKQSLSMVNFKELRLNGVLDIIGFDEGLITLDSDFGRIYVEGIDMKIESLEKDGGNIFITGEIKGIFKEGEVKGKKGFFSKFFG